MISTKDASSFHGDGFSPHRNVTSTFVNRNVQSLKLKRLCSSREELEQSWLGPSPNQDLRCVSGSNDDYCFAFQDSESGRTKRRRTIEPNDDEMAEDSVTTTTFTKIRITPDNRPISNNSTNNIMSGWYEGELDMFGNRAGTGVTKHDDGTSYSGSYASDFMEGEGKYTFVTTREIIPNPHVPGGCLERQVEKTFVGKFLGGKPEAGGTLCVKTWAISDPASSNVQFAEVVHDIGYYRDGRPLGEGARFVYTNTNINGVSTLEAKYWRLADGQDTHKGVAYDYAVWLCHCLGVDVPEPPRVDDLVVKAS